MSRSRLHRKLVQLLMVTALILVGIVAQPVWADDSLERYLASLHDGNLLINPDFEIQDPDIPGRPLGWEPTFNLFDFNQPIWDDEILLSGSRSIRMAAPMDTESSWTSARVPVKPNTTYRFTGYIRTENVVIEKPRFYGTFLVQLYEGDRILFPRPTKAGDNMDGTHDWTRVSFTFTTNHRATHVEVIAALSSFGRASGHVWFDAVKLEEVDDQ